MLHGIVLLALARGLYLARHLPTLLLSENDKSYPRLSPGPHLVAVAHEQLAEAGPVDHIRVEMGCLQCRDSANVAQMEI